MNELKKIGKVLIKDWQIEVLNKYGIKVSPNSTIDEVIFLIDNYLNGSDVSDEEYDELDNIARDLMEVKYYWQTKK